jgi:hypothetical protein
MIYHVEISNFQDVVKTDELAVLEFRSVIVKMVTIDSFTSVLNYKPTHAFGIVLRHYIGGLSDHRTHGAQAASSCCNYIMQRRSPDFTQIARLQRVPTVCWVKVR